MNYSLQKGFVWKKRPWNQSEGL